MSIITISRGSYSHGRAIAEKVAQRLGYECISRDVLLDASKEFNVPEFELVRAIRDAPSILDRFTCRKERYIAYIQAALLKDLQKDNMVYHGFAGHFFVKDIQHVLKVRITADLEDRASIVMERDGVGKKKALRFIKKLDEQRRRWSRHLYGIDTCDPRLYDLVLHIHKISVEDAVDMIIHTVRLEYFKATSESQKEMDDLAKAAEVKAALISIQPNIKVSAQDGLVSVQTEAPESREPKLVQDMKKAVANIPGVKAIKIQVLPITPFRYIQEDISHRLLKEQNRISWV